MTLNHLKRFGITIAFVFMGVAYVGVVWALAGAGYEVVPGQERGSWTGQVVDFVRYAVCTGLVADLTRLTISALWRVIEEPKSQPDEVATRSFA